MSKSLCLKARAKRTTQHIQHDNNNNNLKKYAFVHIKAQIKSYKITMIAFSTNGASLNINSLKDPVFSKLRKC